MCMWMIQWTFNKLPNQSVQSNNIHVGPDKEGLKQEWEINFNENAHICIDKIDVIPTVE